MEKKFIASAGATGLTIAGTGTGFGIAKLIENSRDETVFAKLIKSGFVLSKKSQQQDCIERLNEEFSDVERYKETVEKCAYITYLPDRLIGLGLEALIFYGTDAKDEKEWTTKWDIRKEEIKQRVNLENNEQKDDWNSYKTKTKKYCSEFFKYGSQLAKKDINKEWYDFLNVCVRESSEEEKKTIKEALTRDFWTYLKKQSN